EMPIHIQIDATPVREPFLQVFSVRNRTRQLVTIVEVLSPANKTPSSEGRRLYLQKQRDLLRSNTHLIEIDLLHYGTHTAFPPLSALRRVRPTWDYLVCLHRAQWGGAEADVWFIDLPEPLPTIAVPLLAPDPDVEVNLQAALNEAYEEGQHHRIVDYAADCPAPLPTAMLEWAYATLQTRGLRP
ncbi:MAG: DUF4058 family protein, partial [Armatimonadota bacterium]|nr:DUF4058 family protein [Armatimonadota bacterium]